MRDEAHLREDIDRLMPGLRRYARALVARDAEQPKATADGLAIETFQRAMQAERARQYGNLKIWAFAMLTGLNRIRMKTRPAGPAEDAAPPAAGVDFAPALSDAGRGITDAVSTIPLEDREALLLVVIAGLSYSEAGDAIGVPRHVVAQRVARARTALEANFHRMSGSDPHGRPKHASHLRLVK